MGFLKNGYKIIFNKGNREMTASKTNLPVEDAQALVFFDAEGAEPVDTDSVKFVYTKGTDIYVSEKNIPTDNDIKVLVGDPTTSEVVIGNMPASLQASSQSGTLTPTSLKPLVMTRGTILRLFRINVYGPGRYLFSVCFWLNDTLATKSMLSTSRTSIERGFKKLLCFMSKTFLTAFLSKILAPRP